MLKDHGFVVLDNFLPEGNLASHLEKDRKRWKTCQHCMCPACALCFTSSALPLNPGMAKQLADTARTAQEQMSSGVLSTGAP